MASRTVTTAAEEEAWRKGTVEERLAHALVNDALQKGAGRRDAVAIHDKAVSEPGARYIDFLIPGLLGMNLMGSAIWSMGFAIVDARPTDVGASEPRLALERRDGEPVVRMLDGKVVEEQRLEVQHALASHAA